MEIFSLSKLGGQDIKRPQAVGYTQMLRLCLTCRNNGLIAVVKSCVNANDNNEKQNINFKLYHFNFSFVF
jgi:hypothetical protein